ncbi:MULTISPECIES: bifunctional ribonuclease/(p)ppGpp synthase [Mycobacterium]|uniref:GTP pyrophosphokinase n=1 Tax=Mycobacterium syngnathidarum TaxID=1908205 RepID=A0A1S1JH10_9MYCO|nr:MULTISPECIES: bifunctional ribonuclease/(p)ppGpp synthase [Mycobacterium]MCG7608230.1 bifunctional ribonuclease/(p)ppGpp synthase [Mycobacterium sp. CnD-18-1]OHT85446.1 GTP pyrophosphokinase [Mycobacterium syngnathidarum]OLT93194.1 GTP pyrophosphokinase [Mycobacterium syngnathidarum]
MYFVGLDLAWGEKNQTGVAVIDAGGRVLHVGVAQDDDDIAAAIEPYVSGDCLVAIDAPLIVKNPTGHRPCERDLNRDFQRFDAGARPAFTERPEFKHPRAARLAASLGLDMDPSSSSNRRAIEVYPHPASVALFGLDKTLKYKRGAFGDRQRELLRLMTFIDELDGATPRLRANRNVSWVELRKRIEAATRPGQLDRDEDPVDALLCAYIALYWYHRPEDVTIYGDFASGYIVTPSLPSDRRPGPRPAPGRGAAPSKAVAEYAARRPDLVAATEQYLKLVTGLLDEAGINYLSIAARTKSVDSFAMKANRRAPDGTPMYSDPLVEITDQVGLRVITYLREDVDAVANLLAEEMRLLDDQDMGLQTARQGRWGYASRHLLFGVEGEQYPASIQVRTVLQHAWAEFEHDVRYKGSIPAEHVSELDRRFTLAAGLLELADREFTEIRERLRQTMTDEEDPKFTVPSSDARIPTPVLATYLGNRFPDAGWSRTDHYSWISGLLLELGITSLEALTGVLDSVDTDEINRLMDYRFPPGAVRRLDDALLAVFDDRYIGLDGNAHRIPLLQNRIEKLLAEP